ncbi:AAA family ATPase [Candidatus Micrarchaeota archaeon]|nr:AAA family ATPase [Candidatus Micrarchaeota archaeon]
MERKFTKTGITGFDENLGQGIPKGSILTLSGPTGSGKTTFAMQYLVEGAVKYHEAGLYISLEDTKESLMFSMEGYNWDLEKLERNKQLFFLDYPVSEVDQFLMKNNAVGEIINTMGIERVVIDSIMPIALHFRDEIDRKRAFLDLVSNIRKWGATTIIISEDTTPNPGSVLPETRYEFEKLTDGWIHIYYMLDPEGCRKRYIETIKMKGLFHTMKKFPLEITNHGFLVAGRTVKKDKFTVKKKTTIKRKRK